MCNEFCCGDKDIVNLNCVHICIVLARNPVTVPHFYTVSLALAYMLYLLWSFESDKEMNTSTL